MAYVCTNCGVEYPKWQGKCDSCQEWNVLAQFTPVAKSAMPQNLANNGRPAHLSRPKKLEEIEVTTNARLLSGDAELNRVLGGGIVPGSLVLLGGEPGIGKSTLLLQVALQLKQVKVLYASGEETESQIKIRASRITLFSPNCFLLQENSLTQILKHTGDLQPVILIIDSIQTLYCEEDEGAVGSMTQIRSCTTRLLFYAKRYGVTVFLIGHINRPVA